MNKNVLHPKILSPLFFILYALLFAIFIRYTIYPLINPAFLALIPRLATVLLTSALLGYVFANALQKPRHWFKLLGIGFFMAICAILIISLVAYLYAWHGHAEIFKTHRPWQDYFVIYGTIVAVLSTIIGIWLLPLTGLVVIYFNKRFLPALTRMTQKKRRAHPPQKTTDTDNRLE